MKSRLYWTPDRVLEALKKAVVEIPGRLPCGDDSYNALKKGRLDWPPATYVLRDFHSIARGWLAAGASMKRVSLDNIDWTPEEDNFLLENAGALRMRTIARRLNRSYGSVRTRLNKFHRVRARENQGYLSAAALAKHFGCSYHRVCNALARKQIKGKFDPVRNIWKVDLADITPEAEAILRAPRRTHKYAPLDMGDYYRRYELRRTVVDGKVERVAVSSPR